MKVKNFLAGCFIASAAMIACNNKDKDNMVSDTDRNFMMQVTNSNLSEIAAGDIATRRGSKDSVRNFGSMMITDHTLAQHQLDSIARQRNVTLQTTADTAHKNMAARLQTLSGRQFDTTYRGAQLRDHRMTLVILQSMASNANDASLRNYATLTIPNVQMHLARADTIRRHL